MHRELMRRTEATDIMGNLFDCFVHNENAVGCEQMETKQSEEEKSSAKQRKGSQRGYSGTDDGV